MSEPRSQRILKRVYGLRWLASAVLIVAIIGAFVGGISRVGKFTKEVDKLADNPPEKSEPRMFDPRTDIWFDKNDPALAAFRDLEAKFVGEDPILIAFQTDEPDGVFGVKALETVARLTEELKKIPYVRTVRSLVANPWIRWGRIESGASKDASKDAAPGTTKGTDNSNDDANEDEEEVTAEAGLLVSDLFEKPAARYTQRERHQRMISVLGARNSATLIGDDKVRAIIGAKASYDDHIGEPRLLGNVLSYNGRATAIVVQVIRPHVNADKLASTFSSALSKKVGPAIHASVVQTQALHALRAVVAKEAATHNTYKFHITGIPVMQEHFQTIAKGDLKLVGLMFLVIGLILLVIYRRVAGVLLPLLTVLLGLLGMMGAILIKGDLINGLTAMAPHMLIAIGVANAVHVVTGYYNLRPQYDDKHRLIMASMSFNALPVFLTSTTTAVGFLSLTTSSIFPVQQLGYTVAIGTVLAYLLSMTLVPAVLSLFPLPYLATATDAVPDKRLGRLGLAKQGSAANGATTDEITHWSDPLASFVFRNRGTIVITGVVVTILAIFGLTQVKLTSDMRLMFGKNDPVVASVQWLDKRIGGTGDLEMMFSGASTKDTLEAAGKRQGRIEVLKAASSTEQKAELARLKAQEQDYQRGRIADSARFLTQLDKFQNRLETEAKDPNSPLRILSSFDSGLGVLRKIHQVQNENKGSFYRVPTEDDVPAAARKPYVIRDEVTDEETVIPAQSASTMIAQYYLQFENGAKPEDNLSTLITPDRRTFRVTLRTRAAPSKTTLKAYARMRQIVREEFPALGGSRADVESGKAMSSMALTGNYYMQMNMITAFVNTLIVSLSLALLIITLIITLVFRSLIIGLVSMIPNVIPIMLPLGVLALMGQPLDGPAILVAAVGLGICVDDTIHFLTKYTRARNRGMDQQDAIRATFRDVGAALTYTTIVLICGFAVMTFATFRPNAMIGFLGASMIAAAWVADFLLTPAVLSYIPTKQSAVVSDEEK